MRGRTAAMIAASVVVTSGLAATAASAAGGPPLPKGVGGAKVGGNAGSLNVGEVGAGLVFRVTP